MRDIEFREMVNAAKSALDKISESSAEPHKIVSALEEIRERLDEMLQTSAFDPQRGSDDPFEDCEQWGDCDDLPF